MSLRSSFILVAAIAAIATPTFAMTGAEALHRLNHDGDQTLEPSEVMTAAAAVFKSLTKNGVETVDRTEVAGRVSESDWTAVNKDHDQTLELDEWLTMARSRFDAADTDHDEKLSAAELNAPAGQLLIQMIIK